MSQARNEYMRSYQPDYTARLREQAFCEVGNKCEVCGFDDKRALDFDHIEGGGGAHRRQLKSSYSRLRHVIDNPMLYRTLCKNCNWIAYLESKGNLIPHELRKIGRPVLEIREFCTTCQRVIDNTGITKCDDCKAERRRISSNKSMMATVP